MDAISQGAEGYHPASNHPKWNESYYFWFYDPESNSGGCMRIGLLENLDQSNMYFVLFKDGKMAYNRICGLTPYTPNRMSGGVEIAGLRFTSIEPLTKAIVEYSVGDFSLKLIFEATQPMGDAIAMTPESQNVGMKSLTVAHFEGASRVSGTILLRKTQINLKNAIGWRDLSWGVRDWDGIDHYMLSWPIFANGQTIGAIRAVTVQGREGYMNELYDGKKWLPVSRFEDDIKFFENGMIIESVHYRVWDINDRVWEYSGKNPFFNYLIPHDSFVSSQHWMEFRLNDGTIGYGFQEYGFRLPFSDNYKKLHLK